MDRAQDGAGEAALTSLEPLAGGFSGETFLGRVAGERCVVRVYGGRSAARGPDAPAVDAAVLRLVRGLLPVPDVVEVVRADQDSERPGVLVTSLLPGTRLDLVLPDLDGTGLAAVGRSVGHVVARLACMPMPRRGAFRDADLTIEPWRHELPSMVTEARTDGLRAWSTADLDALAEVAERAEALLDGVTRTCLVHSDLNPKNLLVDPDTLEVTGVLDWEFAHAGRPQGDLGNLLRFDREPDFAAAVEQVYRDLVPDAAADLVDLARAEDLCALIDLAGRTERHAVGERAHDLLLAIARSGDLHAASA